MEGTWIWADGLSRSFFEPNENPAQIIAQLTEAGLNPVAVEGDTCTFGCICEPFDPEK